MSFGDALARQVKQSQPKELTDIRQGVVVDTDGTVDVVGAPVKFLDSYSPAIGDSVWLLEFGPDRLGLGSLGSGGDISGGGFRTGDMKLSVSMSHPGWLLCNGAAVSRSTYSKLFDVIGTTFGAGDGSTTFNIPDFRNRFPVGVGSLAPLGDTGGSNTLAQHLHAAGTLADNHSHDSGNLADNHSHNAGNVLGNHTHGSGNLVNNHSHASGNLTAGNHAHPFTGNYQVVGRGAGGTGNNELQVQGNRAVFNAAVGNTVININGGNTAPSNSSSTSGTTAAASYTANSNTGGSNSVNLTGNTGPSNATSVTGSTANTGSGPTNENRPPFLAIRVLIKV